MPLEYICVLVWTLNLVTGQSTSSGESSPSNWDENFTELLQDLRLVRETLSSKRDENPSANISDCPSNFTYLPDSNKCYRLETDRLEWEVARMRCNSLHPRSHPVIIDGHDENQIISDLVKSRWDIVSRKCWSDSWGGLILIWTAGQRVDPSKRSTFVWKPEPDPSSWSEMKYTGPASWESYHGGQESCLHIGHLRSNGNITWNDAPCGIHTVPDIEPDLGFMCVLCEIGMD